MAQDDMREQERSIGDEDLLDRKLVKTRTTPSKMRKSPKTKQRTPSSSLFDAQAIRVGAATHPGDADGRSPLSET